MPALPDNIVRATRRARVVTREDAAIKTAFPSARDQAERPEPGFFETAADAAAALAIKASLTATFRRRFTATVDGLQTIDPVTGVPTFQLESAELGFSGPAMVARIVLDTEQELTLMEIVG